MQENYLAKWLNGELTEAELKVFKESEEYATYKKIRDVSEKLQSPDFNMEEAWESIDKRREQETPKVITLAPFKTFLKIAAVITVLIVGSYFYLSTLNETVITDLAENKEIILPDNSEIILNAESKLSYDEKNWDKKRNIGLNGEAFFKVAKGKKFTVTTEQGSVTVLGTQFNVENREGFFEVSCFEGLVSVTMNGQETKLSAGHSLIAINGSITKSEVTKNGQPSWLNNESSFKSIPLKYVLAEFQRQHNITVDASQIDDNQLFTGTFSNTDTDLALKSISTPLRIKYKFKGNKVLFYEENAP